MAGVFAAKARAEFSVTCIVFICSGAGLGTSRTNSFSSGLGSSVKFGDLCRYHKAGRELGFNGPCNHLLFERPIIVKLGLISGRNYRLKQPAFASKAKRESQRVLRWSNSYLELHVHAGV